jgi:zinc/manganese transport system ATP-binding protein
MGYRVVVILKDTVSMSQLAVTHFSPKQKVQNNNSPAVDINDISVVYKNKTALQNINGKVKMGSLTAVIGPNGGGKSTFLKALLGLVPLSQGQVQFASHLEGSVAYLPQKCEIDQSFPLTVEDVVASGLYQRQGFFKRIDDESLSKVKAALVHVGMQDCCNRSLNTLSGGQFQRVLFARLIVQDAAVILLDEPFTAIDSYTVTDLVKIIHAWQQQKKTILVVCHDLDIVRDHFPQTLLLAKQVLAWGSTEEAVTIENLRAAKKVAQTLECCDMFQNLTQPLELKV